MRWPLSLGIIFVVNAIERMEHAAERANELCKETEDSEQGGDGATGLEGLFSGTIDICGDARNPQVLRSVLTPTRGPETGFGKISERQVNHYLHLTGGLHKRH